MVKGRQVELIPQEWMMREPGLVRSLFIDAHWYMRLGMPHKYQWWEVTDFDLQGRVLLLVLELKEA